jgi:hypothetical protein
MKSTTNQTIVPTQPAAPVSPVTPPPAAPARPRSWLRRIIGGGQIIETCPTFRDGTTWCVQNHADDAAGHLDDLFHGSERVAMDLNLRICGDDEVAKWPILAAHVEVHPYSDRPEWGVPHVVLEVSVDDVLESMSMEQFAGFLAAGRAHFDRLESEVLGLAQQVRAEYEQQRAVTA